MTTSNADTGDRHVLQIKFPRFFPRSHGHWISNIPGGRNALAASRRRQDAHAGAGSAELGRPPPDNLEAAHAGLASWQSEDASRAAAYAGLTSWHSEGVARAAPHAGRTGW